MTKKFPALFFAIAASTATAQPTPEFLDEYCLKCHNAEDWAGSLDMEGLNYEHVEKDAEVWEKIVRKVRAGMMPPKGEERPDRTVMDGFAAQLETRLDSSVATIPAVPALHRLNRSEYANAIRDIFGMEILRTRVVVMVASIVMLVALYFFVMRSKTGKAIRAVAEDKDVAPLMGVDVDRTIAITFAVGAAMAGAAGILYGLMFGQTHFFMGFIPGIKAFTAAVLGGIGSIPGAA